MPHQPHPSTFQTVPFNTWVLPEHKVVYVSAAKVACTTLKWMVADLAGEDHRRIDTVASGMQSRLMTIHPGRSLLQHVQAVHTMPADEVAQISPDNGWFVFGALRDPWSRLWSAWQSKVLVRANRYLRHFGDEPFFPRVPTKASDIVEDFRTFVEMAPWTTHPELKEDLHFRPQVRALQPDKIPYTRIYDLTDFKSMTADLHAHLQAIGKDQELYVPRANETPVPMSRDVWADGLKERVEVLFREDFDAFGDRWDFDKLKFAPDGWTQDAVDHAAFQTQANDWIGQVWKTGKRWRRQRDAATRKLRNTERQIARAERRVKRLQTRNDRLQAGA